MIDNVLRNRFRVPIDNAGIWLARRSVTATGLTGIGFAAGLGGCVALTQQFYGIALVCLVLNRLADLFDGAVARATVVTDFGGFLDIVTDLLIYSGYVLAFAVGRPENAIAAAVLIYTFLGTGTTFLAAAIIAAKRNITREPSTRKSFFYNAALAEGTESTIYLALICIVPDYFAVMSYIFAGIGFASLIGHFTWASQMAMSAWRVPSSRSRAFPKTSVQRASRSFWRSFAG
ncbi:MAG: CDP-alcohol phosphatidyltransferase family protein [Rhizobiales bacterium]|nr:CDP-alcohol phosphatidyltransferase family protein [Hyphomicrobiales bacterium]